MLKGFEPITDELRGDEKNILMPMVLAKIACHRGNQNPIMNREIIEYCGNRGIKTSEPRIRKVMQYIRNNHMVEGLVATRRGYFIAEDPNDLLKWVETMRARRNAIDASIKSVLDAYDTIISKPAITSTPQKFF